MGGEFGQSGEWNHDQSLDWHLLDMGPYHRGLQRLVADLNRLYRAEPSLHELDCESAGFAWMDCADAEQSVVAFARFARDRGRLTLCVCNFTPVPRHGYRVGVPVPGFYREILNSDGGLYGGSDAGNGGGVWSEPIACAWPASLRAPDPAAARRALAHAGGGLGVMAAAPFSTRPGASLPAGRHLGRSGRQLRAVQRARDGGRPLPLRQRRSRARDPADRRHRAHRPDLARLSARSAPGPPLRLPRPRPLRAGTRAPLQSGQGPARPLREGDGRQRQLGQRGLRLRPRRGGDERHARPARQRGLRSQVRRHRAGVLLGRRHAPPDAMAQDRHLRGPRQGLHRAAPAGAAASSAAPTRASPPRPLSST